MILRQIQRPQVPQLMERAALHRRQLILADIELLQQTQFAQQLGRQHRHPIVRQIYNGQPVNGMQYGGGQLQETIVTEVDHLEVAQFQKGFGVQVFELVFLEAPAEQLITR